MRAEVLAIGLAGLGVAAWYFARQQNTVTASPTAPLDPVTDPPSVTDFLTLDWSQIFTGTGMTDSSLPKGIRNNNPLNIRFYSMINWQGQTGDDGTGFAVFESMFYGLRAAAKDMNTKRGRGINTIGKIIPIWAPHGDSNPVENYIAFVEQRSGIARNKILVGYDYAKVIEAMAYFENGGDYLDMAEIEQAVRAGGLV